MRCVTGILWKRYSLLGFRDTGCPSNVFDHSPFAAAISHDVSQHLWVPALLEGENAALDCKFLKGRSQDLPAQPWYNAGCPAGDEQTLSGQRSDGKVPLWAPSTPALQGR